MIDPWDVSDDYLDSLEDTTRLEVLRDDDPVITSYSIHYTKLYDGAGGGAPKNDAQEDKPMMHLIPMDLLAHFLEPAYREGLIKYYWESWRKGFSISRMISGLRRHEEAFYHRGEDLDPDAVALGINKHHLGGMLFCVLCMCDTVMNHPEMDDRPIKRMYEPLP